MHFGSQIPAVTAAESRDDCSGKTLHGHNTAALGWCKGEPGPAFRWEAKMGISAPTGRVTLMSWGR